MAWLTHHSYLLAAENKLVAATLGEVILCEYLAALVNLFACSLLVFLRNAVRQSILNKPSENGENLFHRKDLMFTLNLCRRLLRPDFWASVSVFGSAASLYERLSLYKIDVRM
jgi:hypothetical protein